MDTQEREELKVRAKRIGQAVWVVPSCKKSRAIAKEMGVLTLTPEAVKTLTSLGYEVTDLEEIDRRARALAVKFDPEDTTWEESPRYLRKRPVPFSQFAPAWLVPHLPSIRANKPKQQQQPQTKAQSK